MKLTNFDGVFYKDCCINCYYCKLEQNKFVSKNNKAVKCKLGGKKSTFAANYYYFPSQNACSHFHFIPVKPYKIQDLELLLSSKKNITIKYIKTIKKKEKD